MQKKGKRAVKNRLEENSGKKGEKIILDLFGTEILERNVSKFGTGAHVLIPKEHLGKKIKIIIEDDQDE
jgi:putative transposon-encoded protein